MRVSGRRVRVRAFVSFMGDKGGWGIGRVSSLVGGDNDRRS